MAADLILALTFVYCVLETGIEAINACACISLRLCLTLPVVPQLFFRICIPHFTITVNYGLINSVLTKVDWDTLMEGNTDECWTRFKKLLLDLEDELYTKTYSFN